MFKIAYIIKPLLQVYIYICVQGGAAKLGKKISYFNASETVSSIFSDILGPEMIKGTEG